MKERLAEYKELVDNYLTNFLEEKKKEVSQINMWGEDLIKRLKVFVCQGKTIRGSLLVMTYKMFKNEIDENTIKAAAAIELLHSALLIHDDIIDKDVLRRGKKTIFAQYEEMCKEENFEDARHFGYSMGICAGDVCISSVFEILGTLETKDEVKSQIIKLFSEDLNCTGLAEMEDIYMGFSKKEFNEERIINIYRYKTARYTFSAPFLGGAILAEQDEETMENLLKLGDHMGIIFQIKDDELGLFGSELEIGKTIGSDIAENKKTLLRLLLFEKVSPDEKEKLRKIFGNQNLDENMVNFVRELIDKYKIREDIYKKIEVFESKAKYIISNMKITEEHKEFFREFLAYNIGRKK
ncbi:MAG: polyprenyl synthetase family protein [Nanoarchaeota archaeon]|nr:polyprenyl synthetase family protein [Nanoarchaeota archaeon]